ncbi:hypothetical protein PUNSTDRAFT_128506 [Punctularia strigosozonata HHB-11173 SS5]|uniref:Golgi apparatus membrane protein TVP38 n=1 Tax=Punctularia strigosozonata (strain HHB-11173) TaxID=741275 RepID=R7S3W2_PUNST|nr:uncharacterized protein PUNSTDRAFT_128506 [Punctularia strigosozonata HHB-11173 SS5]EIN03921.1 hypothetical protein PUNSTDRAFT_128506 [Punctularia strigosozonata HHB-11173 SS5]
MAQPYPAYGAPQPNYGYPYPPAADYSAATLGANNHTITGGKPEYAGRTITRTPSPTPSEQAELTRKGAIDFKAMMNWRYWIRREWLWYYILGAILVVLTALMTIYHKQIVHWLTPAGEWMRDLKFGFLIPIAILFVISFPPLFGHEIVAVLCGLVWGLGIGFAIVAAGTFIGELGNFYAFKYCCRARGEKMEKTNIGYACLAKVVRDGGFKIALIARLSAIPGHFTTAVFSTCGMGVITFSIAAILSLPKQFITVYLGVILEQSESGPVSLKTRLIDYSVVAITTLITILAMWYIYHRMNKVKPDVIYARRKARQAKLAYDPSFTSNSSLTAFNPAGSDTDIPLGPYQPQSYQPHSYQQQQRQSPYQQWDASGRAVGYAPDPRLHAPQPHRPVAKPTSPSPSPADYRPVPVRRATDESLSTASGGSGESVESLPGARFDAHYARTGEPSPLPSPAYAPPPPPPTGRQATKSPAPFSQYYAQDPHQTPTQAQFASFPPPHQQPASPRQSSPMDGALPTPPYQQQQQQYQPPPPPPPPPSQGRHAQEETDATFYTASDHSRTATQDSVSVPYLPSPHYGGVGMAR